MKKKLFTLLTLLLCLCSTAWADEVTIGLSNSVSTTSGTTSTETLTGIGSDLTLTKVYKSGKEASGSSSDKYLTAYSGEKGLYDKATKYYVSSSYTWKNSSSSSYPGCYVGYKVEVAEGKKFSINGLGLKVIVDGNIYTYKVVIENSSQVALYTSAELAVTSNYNNASANNVLTVSNITADAVQELTGSFYVKLYVKASSTSKYFCPVYLNVTGDLETKTADYASPEITTNLSEDTYNTTIGTPLNLSIAASHAESYQWYWNTSKSTTGGIAIEGETSKMYTYTPTEATTKYFYCIVTNSNATGVKTATSNIATVTSSLITPEFTLSNSSILVDGTAQIKVGNKSGLDGLTMSNLTYDNTIVSISDEGVITGLVKGTTTITFTTVASGNYAAGTANLSVSVTGKVVASSTPASWTGATSRTWSVSKIAFGSQGADGDNGLYFKTGTSNSINYTSGDYFSLKEGNVMYLEVPSASSTGLVKVVSTQNDNNRYLNIVNASGTQQLKMSKTGNSVRFDANSIEEIDGIYYIKLARGAGECKIPPSNFATVSLDVAVAISAAEYATFCNAAPLDFSETGITVYTAQDKETSVGLTEIESGQVPANTPVVLYKEGADGTAINVPVIASAAAIEGANDLRVSTGTDVDYMYVLAMNPTIGFYPWTGTNLPADKIYLQGKASYGARSFIGFDSDTTTAIDNVVVKTIDANAPMYNLAGQRVNKSYKGVVIVNGKKMLNK